MTIATYLGHDPGGYNADHAPDATLTTFRAQATTIYYQLRDAHIRAAAAVDSMWSRATIPESARTGFNSELASVVQAMGILGPNGSLTNAVLEGSRPISAWQQVADTTRDTIVHILTTLGETVPSIGRLWVEVVKPTVEQAGQAVKNAAELGVDLLPWVAVAVVALVVGYVVFSLRR